MPKLADIAEINPRLDRSAISDLSEVISFVPMANVSEVFGAVVSEESRKASEVIKGFTPFKDRDVLIAKITPCFENGKIAHARIARRLGFGSTEFHVVRPKTERLEDRYLYHFLRQPAVREAGERRMTGSAGQKRVPKAFFEELNIPLPPIPEQRRIAAILDKADSLCAKRRETIAKLDQLLQSVFLEMFGDPVENPKDWNLKPFTELGEWKSGATPSKSEPSYWEGSFPWVSPKDMKVSEVSDAQDHVSEVVFTATNLKRIEPGQLLIVVRGMILAHSFPTAINVVPVAINQDMKAIQPIDELDIVYLKSAVDALKDRILSVVSTAGHGTRRLDMRDASEVMVPVPPVELQSAYKAVVQKYAQQRKMMVEQLAQLERAFSSIQTNAFSGTL